jgi:hypothetical protein
MGRNTLLVIVATLPSALTQLHIAEPPAALSERPEQKGRS